MLNASNNHFDNRSEFEIPKKRPFSNLTGAKFTKNGITTLFGIDFERCNDHKMKKNIWGKIAFDLIFHLRYIFLYFVHVVPLKKFAKKNFTPLLAIFAPF